MTAALIYGVASFAVEYAIGFWPHAVTTFFVSAAVAAAACGWRGETRHEMLGFLVAGLAIGVAVNIRVDAVLAVPGLAAWILIAARRPYVGLAMLALGLAPGLAAATWINYVKFGRLSPVTYGNNRGGASLDHYAKWLPVFGAVAVGFLLLGIDRVRAMLSGPLALAGLLACVAAAVMVVPSLTALASRLARGAFPLVVNFQAIPLPGWGLYLTEQGIITAWGLPKKALLESLPYVAATVLLLPRLFRGPNRTALALCFLFPLPFLAFFSLNTWHGGGNNMRYFLSAVPALAILSAVALSEITHRLGERSWPALIAGSAALGGAILYAEVQGYPAGFILQHVLPTAIMTGLVGFAVVLWLTRGPVQGAAARAMLSLFTLGLATATVNGWGVDMVTSQHSRARNAQVIEKAAELPTNALIVSSMLEQTPFRPALREGGPDQPRSALCRDVRRLRHCGRHGAPARTARALGVLHADSPRAAESGTMTTGTDLKLVIQLPCYNEAAQLPAALADLPRQVPGFDRVEWLVIDDGSTGGTAEVARAHGADHVVRPATNRGLAAAEESSISCIRHGGLRRPLWAKIPLSHI